MFRKARPVITPLARIEGLSITDSGDETLVYDRDQFVIHRLSADVARVWKLADGQKDISFLATETGLSIRIVEDAVQSLAAMNLVQGNAARNSPVSRRLFLGGAAGAAAAGTFISAYAAVSDICKNSPECASRCGKPVNEVTCDHHDGRKICFWKNPATGSRQICAS